MTAPGKATSLEPDSEGARTAPRRHNARMPYIDTIPEDDATGTLARQYAASRTRDRRVAGIVRLMSQNPDALADLMRLHATVAMGPSGLSRAQREMIALVVSRANGCLY